MELSDGVITLRRPTEADADEVASAVRASIEELAPFMPWATPHYGSTDALAWIRDETDPGSEGFVVIDHTDGEIVGIAGLQPLNHANRRVEIGYWTRSDRTGRGYASRATRLLARHAIEHRGAGRVEIVMSVENHGSRRSAEKAGATHEGILREYLLIHGSRHDAHILSILPADLT